MDERITLPPLTDDEKETLVMELPLHPTIAEVRAKQLELLARRNGRLSS